VWEWRSRDTPRHTSKLLREHELAEVNVSWGRESSRQCSFSWREAALAEDLLRDVRDANIMEGQGRLQYELRYVFLKTLYH
jgi:hypothetical protein